LRHIVKLHFKDRKIGRGVVFVQVASEQEVTGITSKVGRKHMVFFDIENQPLSKIERVLTKIQRRYKLSNIYLTSDRKNSYHGWCYSRVSYPMMLKILIDSFAILDYGFFLWTVKRKAATLRVSKKHDRPFQKVTKVIKSYYVPMPDKVRKVTYTTGTDKYPQQVIEKVSGR
jgi:hypothetical protein